MLEKPDIEDQEMIDRLREVYGLEAARVTFLPLGADIEAAVYRVVTAGGRACFLKLTSRAIPVVALDLPHYLRARGNPAIIAPLETRSGQLFGSLGRYKMILYPFVEGLDGYQRSLTERQWTEFGAALKAIHAVELPEALKSEIPRESFSPQFREMARRFLVDVQTTAYIEPVAAKLAAFMRAHSEEIDQLVTRADQLGAALASRSPEFVLCHSDIHPGNLLIPDSGNLYIVDWDNPLFAPREKDLALIGGCSTWKDPAQAFLFYRGYGPAPVDREALAYFRYERVIQDIAEFCKQLLLSDTGGEDREQAYEWFTGNFRPGAEIDLARDIDVGAH